MTMKELKLFSGNAHRALVAEIAQYLKLPVGDADVTRFSDGEVFVQINENVRGSDVFVVQPTCPPVNDNLMELLVMIDAFKRASAGRITAVLPYYGYARQDRKVQGRVPITAKLVADLISTAGAERVLCLDLHAGQIQGFFNIPVDNIYGMPVLLQQIRTLVPPREEVVVVSPDAGGVERARAFAKRLEATIAIGDKRRDRKDIAEVTRIVGDVDGKTAVIVDDIVSTGSSLAQTAEALRAAGASRVLAAITHPVLAGEAVKRIEESCIERFITTDTIPVQQAVRDSEKFVITTVAHLLGEAIRRIHNEESVSSLFI